MKRVLIVLALMFVAAVGVLSAQSGAKKIYEVSDEVTAPRLIEAATPGYSDEAKKKGLGIGMYQTKMIVEAHDGRILVDSKPGAGTTFRILFPVTHG